MFEICGTVALVTGGASGIGLAVAKELLLNKAKGVTIADINQQAGDTIAKVLQKEFGDERVIFVLTDVTDKRSYENAFKQTVAIFKNIDILVNNAGIVDELDYEKMISVNLTGSVHGILLALENYIYKHKTNSEGVIINTASIAAVWSQPFGPVYSAAKSGVVSLTTAFGHKVHYDRTKIKVVAVCPGGTDTNIAFVNRNEFNKFLMLNAKLLVQPVQHLAKSMIKIIKEKPSASVWIVKDSEDAVEYIYEILKA
ncbi:hypothetical protein HHI36_004975 [Cryptolaemus montrouzieri]|uniref:Alcohol dehydrogenase n=1 Tax=Cryptolaemus montrouzieri TaxID=559131 RepID=A0ABD2NT28_9CUCU